MKTINWGIIGAGGISTRFAKVVAGAEGMTLRAVYNRHIE
ncbi:MAG: gfo/Idh/MocA family oxidoreductase, partial [Clostridia bacterium]|nr:gfo/Idh/MocA family oxidoreductase [Clostridia bacterium]